MNRKPELNVVAFQGAALDRGVPPKPDTIARDLVASAEWDRVVLLGGVGAKDAGLLAAYCSTYSRAEKLREAFAKLDELFVASEGGAVKTHPVIGALNSAERLLGMHAARLGFTPVDASRVKDGGKTKAAEKKISKYL